VVQEAQKKNKNLIIVGGTSFYLKSLLDGISPLPNITPQIEKKVHECLNNTQKVHTFLSGIDPKYMEKIMPNDRYRLEKALLIYEASQQPPSLWFEQNPPKPIITNLDIYNIDVSREVLRERIVQRTHKMYKMGLIDEVCALEHTYTRKPNSMGAIGIVEVLEYLDNKVTKDEMLHNIITHTAQLAKRQQTFNRTQFAHITSAPLEELRDNLTNLL
jgi:tRNA dimethylallyltransferase